MAVRDFGAGASTLSRTARLISAVTVAGLLAAAAFTTRDLARVERENAVQPPASSAEAARDRPRAEAEWRIARRHLEARLGQGDPLELGAVWFTRSGRICGIVNGLRRD